MHISIPCFVNGVSVDNNVFIRHGQSDSITLLIIVIRSMTSFWEEYFNIFVYAMQKISVKVWLAVFTEYNTLCELASYFLQREKKT